MEALINYAYGGRIALHSENVFNLFVAASFLQVFLFFLLLIFFFLIKVFFRVLKFFS